MELKKISVLRKQITYCIKEVTFIIPMWVKHIFTKARPYLVNFLIPHGMAQEIRVSVILSIAYLYIEYLSLPLVCKKLIDLLLHGPKTNNRTPRDYIICSSNIYKTSF